MKFIYQTKNMFLLIFALICLLIVGITILYYYIINESSNRGTFGDMFGGLNTIFSGFAFAGLIITIIMQMKELELTREELKRSAEAQDKTQKALNDQLNSMQLTSRIDSLNQYLKNFDEIEDIDKTRIVREILKVSTESLFFLSEYSQYTKPELVYHSKPQILRPPKIPSGIYVKLKLMNKGTDLIDLKIELPSGVSIPNKTETIDNGSTLLFEINSPLQVLNIQMIYKGRIVNHQWRQSLQIDLINSCEVIISKPELINKYDDKIVK